MHSFKIIVSFRFCIVKSKHEEKIYFFTLCIESLAFWQQQGLKGVNCWGSTTMEKSFALRSEGKNSKTKELQLQKKAERKVVMKVSVQFSGDNGKLSVVPTLW